jgi:tetratricopeptide (TPR) repeat protein
MKRGSIFFVFFSVLLIASSAYADPTADAQKLKDEAIDILKANAQKSATTEQYANCIYKLEQAQAILEKAGNNDSALTQEVTSSLFWARRFSNIQILNALEKLRGGAAPPPPPKKVEVAKPAKPADPEEAPDTPAEILAAKKAYETAEKFAQSHSADDYAVALRWFQMANEFPNNDYAFKALQLARDAQTRFAAKTGSGEAALPDTPEMKLVNEADELAKGGKLEQAIALYLASIKMKETAIARRKLGHAYFKRGQQLKDDLMPRWEVNLDEVRKAWSAAIYTVNTARGPIRRLNRNSPPLVAAWKKQAALRDEAQDILKKCYDPADTEFRAVLKLATNNRDFDAAGHLALCQSIRGGAMAKSNLGKFLVDYTPANDLERSLYEFCKTEREHLK